MVTVPLPPRTIREAAAELNCAVATVRLWIRQRKLGHIRLGRVIRIPADEIQRFLNQRYSPADDQLPVLKPTGTEGKKK